jgi:hypothetical protein
MFSPRRKAQLGLSAAIVVAGMCLAVLASNDAADRRAWSGFHRAASSGAPLVEAKHAKPAVSHPTHTVRTSTDIGELAAFSPRARNLPSDGAPDSERPAD